MQTHLHLRFVQQGVGGGERGSENIVSGGQHLVER